MADIMTVDELVKAGATFEDVRENGVRRATLKWESLTDFAQSCPEMRNYGGATRDGDEWVYGAYRHTEDRNTFTRFDSLRDAVTMGRSPREYLEAFEKARTRAHAAIKDVKATMVSTKRRRVRRVEGSELLIDRVAVGNPECWESRVRGAQKRTVRIAINFAYTAGTSTEEFTRGALRGLVAADALQAAGYGVELWGTACGQPSRLLPKGTRGRWSSGDRLEVMVKLKASDQPLDPQNLLVTGCSGMFRAFVFMMRDAISGVVESASDSRSDKRFAFLCEHHGFDAVASGTDDFEYPVRMPEDDAVRDIINRICETI